MHKDQVTFEARIQRNIFKIFWDFRSIQIGAKSLKCPHLDDYWIARDMQNNLIISFFFFFIHLGSKPHACELCNKRFALACNLRAHMKTHEDEQQENCVRCGRCFLSSSGSIKEGICRQCEDEPISVDDEVEAIPIHHKKFSNKSMNIASILAQ